MHCRLQLGMSAEAMGPSAAARTGYGKLSLRKSPLRKYLTSSQIVLPESDFLIAARIILASELRSANRLNFSNVSIVTQPSFSFTDS